jgi:quercetin dioxygenase-like cupin family protein
MLRENARVTTSEVWLRARKEYAMNHLCIASALLVLATPLSAKADSVTVNPLLTTSVTASGQPIVLPQGNVQLITSMYEIAPGAKLPEHEHNSQRYGYLLAGQLRITNTETGTSQEYKPGDFIVESRGQWHKAENIGAEPIKLLVIDQINPGESTVVLRHPGATVGHN